MIEWLSERFQLWMEVLIVIIVIWCVFIQGIHIVNWFIIIFYSQYLIFKLLSCCWFYHCPFLCLKTIDIFICLIEYLFIIIICIILLSTSWYSFKIIYWFLSLSLLVFLYIWVDISLYFTNMICLWSWSEYFSKFVCFT